MFFAGDLTEFLTALLIECRNKAVKTACCYFVLVSAEKLTYTSPKSFS
jgi:hypothetical protein